jgi:hypothetical protein
MVGISASTGTQVLRVGVDGVALGGGAQGPLSPAGFALHAFGNAVDDHLALELSEDAEHLHEHAACGCGGVERLGRRAEHDRCCPRIR